MLWLLLLQSLGAAEPAESSKNNACGLMEILAENEILRNYVLLHELFI